MNLVLVFANVLGFLAFATSCLKVLETGPSIGPAFSPAARLVLLLLVFASIFSAIEAASWPHPMRPGESIMIATLGSFSVWRTFQTTWVSFFQRPDRFMIFRRREPKV